MNMQIFADCDNTITLSKQKISPEMKNTLSKLENPVIVVSGASRSQLEWQLDGLKCIILAQGGNDSPLWQNKLSKEEVWEIMEHIVKFGEPLNEKKFENRGSMVGYSLIGHDKPQEVKTAYDPEGKRRQNILKIYPFKSKTLTVKIGGTTCLDYTKKNGTKGKNIERWIKENRLNKKDCVYYGDALFKGGNDESVVGIISTITVKNPSDLLKKL